MQVIENVIVYQLNKAVKGYVVIDEEYISEVGEGDYNGDISARIDGKGQHLLPGFIDIHIHGGYGQDAMDADEEALRLLSDGLMSEGTTSFLATTMTEDLERVAKAMTAAAQFSNSHGAEIIGIHMEGPFISADKVGAQNPKYVKVPTVEQIKHLQQQADGLIKIITMAPEVEGAMEVIEALGEEMIISLGHTTADYDKMNEAAEHGARHITHLYNAATGFSHREPGAFAAAWLNDKFSVECIVDGIHSHPAAVLLAYRLKGIGQMMLITDSMRAKGMPDGEYELGGQPVFKTGERAVLGDGTLAGSVLTMNGALRNFMQFTGVPLEEAWRVTSYNQAAALGMDDRGVIEKGKYADLVLVDQEINVLMTVKKGYIKNITN